MVIGVMASSCTLDNSSLPINHTSSEETTKQKLLSQGQGFLFGLRGKPEEKGTRLQSSFHISAGSQFEAICTANNHRHQSLSLLITCFINYQQVNFQLDAIQDVTHTISFEPWEEKTFTIKTEPLGEDYYDFILLMFKQPFNPSSSPEWRRTSMGALYARRANLNLYVGNIGHPAKSFPLYPKGETEPIIDGVFLTHNRKEVGEPLPVWCSEKVSPGEVVRYFTHVGSKHEPKSFALMYLLDYHQVPQNVGAENLVTFGTLPRQTQIIVPSSFEAPQEKGAHELLVIFVPNPYAQLEESPGIFASIDHVSQSSARTLIIVE
jgi:hypothetical protein